jgi:hypothetical protein
MSLGDGSAPVVKLDPPRQVGTNDEFVVLQQVGTCVGQRGFVTGPPLAGPGGGGGEP